MSKIKREQLLKELNSVVPGLSEREIVEQSSCFVFKDGKVYTFNDEIACWARSSLGITGAVSAKKLISLLQSMPEENLNITTSKKGKLIIKGMHKQATYALESKIALPIESIKSPKTWKSLPSDFLEGLSLVADCAGRDESNFVLTCIHIAPEKLEASDNTRLAKFNTKTDVRRSMLIRKDTVKHLITAQVTKFGETKDWVHFRRNNGPIICCRRYTESFPDSDEGFKISGKKMTLPKGLEKAARRAAIFSADNPEDSDIFVTLTTNRALVRGTGTGAEFQEIKKIKYVGKPLTFLISPTQLIALTHKHNSCIVSQEKLKATSGQFEFVAALGVTPQESDAE